MPYDDFPNRNEYWYRSLFIMLLKGAGIASYAEFNTFRGSDLLLQFSDLIVVLEFKFTQKSSHVERMMSEDMNDREYAKSYALDGCKVITSVLVANDEERQIVTI